MYKPTYPWILIVLAVLSTAGWLAKEMLHPDLGRAECFPKCYVNNYGKR
ncbi:hypothetical protein [Bradyrhizobium lablabi]|nr:hypothetical protein [Bradyrhizobium lablabi]MBR0696172.1 hypothetical protein [Bradyrhizobium lablabi]